MIGGYLGIVAQFFSLPTLQVGDKVELVEGFERYGDALGGPLQAGDRGVVVELQRGPNGEKYVASNVSVPCLFHYASN
jgi:hypothetical protein